MLLRSVLNIKEMPVIVTFCFGMNVTITAKFKW